LLARQLLQNMADKGRSIAYAKGAWAAINGISLEACPFAAETFAQACEEWIKGWYGK